jgi:serine/threonine protein kinase
LDGTAKISDFGLSRKIYGYANYVKKNQEPLPWRWMAIESLERMEFSTESDVWAYGVTLYEIFSLGNIPYQGLAWNTEFSQTLRQGLRLGKPDFATDSW